ncbi:hypothetical protein YC2023_011528 [Brassica napus]
MRKQVNFGELVVFQIRRINSDLTEDSDVNFPNFIHQIMECQKDISHMFDDDQVMGEPQCIDQDKIGKLVELKHDEHVVLCALTNVECGSCCEQHAGFSMQVQE